MTSQMTIAKKLFLSFGIALALTLTVSALALHGFTVLGADLKKVVTVNARKVFLAADLNGIQSDMVGAERGILARAFMKDKSTMDQYNREYAESVAKAKLEIAEFIPLIETAEARQNIGEIQSSIENAVRLHEELYAEANAGRTDAAAVILKSKAMPHLLHIGEVCDRLQKQQTALMANVVANTESSVSRNRWITIILVALSLIMGSVVVWVVRQINAALRHTIVELSEGAEQVSSAAGQVSSSSQSLAQGSSEQAASLEETSASTEQINAMARRNSESTREAASVVGFAQQNFVQATESLNQTVKAMNDIHAQSGKISKIIKVIDEIAFQTNILALNAAVEAARAGEAGMGFAVVADEVRNLAQRCAQAARDTAELIEESITKSKEGKDRVDQVAIAIGEIAEQAGQVKVLVDEVNQGSQEQTRGIQEMARAVTQMQTVTQSTAANAEEGAAAAEELNAQSGTMKTVVERLSSMVGGSKSENSYDRQTPRRAAATLVQQQPRRPGSGLAPSRKAAAHPPATPGVPAHLAQGAETRAFSLDDEFTEF